MKICFLVLAFAISASVHCIPIQTKSESHEDSAASNWIHFMGFIPYSLLHGSTNISDVEGFHELFKQPELNDSAANSLPFWYGWLPQPVNLTVEQTKKLSQLFKQPELNDSAANSLPYWYGGFGIPEYLNLTEIEIAAISQSFKQSELNDSAANSLPYWFGPFWIDDPVSRILRFGIITGGILPPVFNNSELKDSAANSLPYWIGPLGIPDTEEKNLTVKAITEISQLFKQPELNGSAANGLPIWIGIIWYPDPVSTIIATGTVIRAIFGSLGAQKYRPDKPAPHKVKPRKPKITTTTTTTLKPTTTTTTEPPPPPKPKVWVAVNDPVSFEDAQRQCSITGAHLATPETPVEIQKIETIMAHVDKKSCTGEVWIGLRQDVETGNFTWVTGLPLGRFTYWTPEVSVEEGSCISQSLTNGTDVEWHKRTCSRNLCYICEFLL